MTDVKARYTYRTAIGVWLNDTRNRALTHEQWPCVTMDERAIADLIDNIRLQAEFGYDSVVMFGLITTDHWLPDIPGTVTEKRARDVRRIIQEVHECGMKIIYGLGVYSWGFDNIIAHDPAVRRTNPHAMCGSRPESRRWMEKVLDYLIAEFDFDGFHLEAADRGRCDCPECARESNTEYYSRINAETAAYIRKNQPDSLLLVNMCGYLPGKGPVPREEFSHLVDMSRHVDFLIDVGHGCYHYYITPELRGELISQLHCEFGTSGNVWVYPPQRWNRLRWFLPYTNRNGLDIEQLYEQGGRAMEYYMGPAINPSVEVNIAFAGRKLNDVRRSNRDVLLEVIDVLYEPGEARACEALADVFEQAEYALLENFDPLSASGRDPDGPDTKLLAGDGPIGTIDLAPPLGTSPGPPIYLQEAMTPRGRAAYARKLNGLLGSLPDIERRVRAKGRMRRMKTAIENVLTDIAKVDRRT